MALINCPERSAQVSDKAINCQNCGYQLRKPKRGVVGGLIKWTFILLNILMIAWLYSGIGATADIYESTPEAGKDFAALGAGIGVSIILGFWVAGDIILGILVLLTRPK